MTKQELLQGKTFEFDNEQWCINNETDDLRSCICWFDGENEPISGFKIVFNRKYLHSSKTFPPFEKRFNELKEKWSLKETEESRLANLIF